MENFSQLQALLCILQENLQQQRDLLKKRNLSIGVILLLRDLLLLHPRDIILLKSILPIGTD
jgi:hypothetical protein